MDWNLVRYALQKSAVAGYSDVSLKKGEFEFSAQIDLDAEIIENDVQEPDTGIANQTKEGEVCAGHVGTFKASDPSIEAGVLIETGDVVGQVVALGIVNDIKATVSGEVTEVLTTDGDPIEFGQSVMKVKL